MESLLVWADTHGVVRVALEVVETNTAGIGLYASLGFEHEGRLRARRKTWRRVPRQLHDVAHPPRPWRRMRPAFDPRLCGASYRTGRLLPLRMRSCRNDPPGTASRARTGVAFPPGGPSARVRQGAIADSKILRPLLAHSARGKEERDAETLATERLTRSHRNDRSAQEALRVEHPEQRAERVRVALCGAGAQEEVILEARSRSTTARTSTLASLPAGSGTPLRRSSRRSPSHGSRRPGSTRRWRQS